MKTPEYLLLLVLLLVTFFSPGEAGSLDNGTEHALYRAEGNAVIQDGDLSQARDDAIRDALENAVRQAMSRLLSSMDAERSGEILEKAVIPNAREYIREYRIVTEQVWVTVYQTEVMTTVYLEGLAKAMRALGFLREEPLAVAAVTLTLKNIESYRTYALLREFIGKEVPDVKVVHQRRIAWKTADLQVELPGGADLLGTELNRFKAFSLDVNRPSENLLEVTILR